MQNVQRHFGRYLKRSADDQQVSLLLKDFDDADQLLTKLIDESKRWREAWLSILTYQHRMFSEFELLYAPIIGAGDDLQGHVAVETPEHLLSRATRLNTEYDALKTDLREILEQVDYMMIKPAQEAKDSLHLTKKTIKKREDKKLDYERYQGRVDSSMKKKGRSDRDNIALVKAERDLAIATEQYKAADDNLVNTLPHILQAVYSLQPHLLAAQVQIQNSLLGHYYTSLHNFCTEEGFPSPAPPMEEVVRVWEEVFKPIQREAETTSILANGKLVRGGQANGYRRPSQNSSTGRGQSVSPARAIHAPPAAETTRPKISSSASSTSLLSAHMNTQAEALPIPSPSQSLHTTPSSSYAPAGPNADYFSRERSTPNSYNNSTNSSTTALSSTIAAKKKPPPPPPPRLNSQQFQFVTALYDFGGQGDGDLVFREGDKIRVIKKTDSTDDWWQGELRGVRGMFPANYCS